MTAEEYYNKIFNYPPFKLDKEMESKMMFSASSLIQFAEAYHMAKLYEGILKDIKEPSNS